MKFNKNWTKQEKSIDYIREYFGNDKLFYHPKKKYYQSGKSAAIPNFKDKIKDFSGFINEIKYESLKTDFTYDFQNKLIWKMKFFSYICILII